MVPPVARLTGMRTTPTNNQIANYQKTKIREMESWISAPVLLLCRSALQTGLCGPARSEGLHSRSAATSSGFPIFHRNSGFLQVSEMRVQSAQWESLGEDEPRFRHIGSSTAMGTDYGDRRQRGPGTLTPGEGASSPKGKSLGSGGENRTAQE